MTSLYLAARDPRTPLLAKLLAAAVVAYALSPIDLIPDPIPVIGYLDDLILLPIGIWLTIRLIPGNVWADCVAEAAAGGGAVLRPSRGAAVVIVGLWLGAFYLTGRLALRLLESP